MALSPPNASSAGLRRPPSCEEGHRSLHAHPSDCDGLHPWIRRIASGVAICSTEAIHDIMALYSHASRSKTSRACRLPLTDPQTHRPRMRQQQEHQQCSDERHIFREVNHVDLLHLGVVYLPEGVHLE